MNLSEALKFWCSLEELFLFYLYKSFVTKRNTILADKLFFPDSFSTDFSILPSLNYFIRYFLFVFFSFNKQNLFLFTYVLYPLFIRRVFRSVFRRLS